METYNILSYYILWVVQIMLVSSILYMIPNIFYTVFSWNHYFSLYWNKQDEDQCKFEYANNWFQIILSFIERFSFGGLLQIYLLQIFEWESMLYVINSQKDRKVEQILYDHNHENMQKTFRLLLSETDYRKKEYRMKNIWTCLLPANFFIYIAF